MQAPLAAWATGERLSARLDVVATAKLLGFAEHDIQILMAAGSSAARRSGAQRPQMVRRPRSHWLGGGPRLAEPDRHDPCSRNPAPCFPVAPPSSCCVNQIMTTHTKRILKTVLRADDEIAPDLVDRVIGILATVRRRQRCNGRHSLRRPRRHDDWGSAGSAYGKWCSVDGFIRSNCFPGWCATEPTKSSKIKARSYNQFLPPPPSPITDSLHQIPVSIMTHLAGKAVLDLVVIVVAAAATPSAISTGKRSDSLCRRGSRRATAGSRPNWLTSPPRNRCASRKSSPTKGTWSSRGRFGADGHDDLRTPRWRNPRRISLRRRRGWRLPRHRSFNARANWTWPKCEVRAGANSCAENAS